MSAPRVLIVKFSAIGDCVMAVPAVSMIRHEEPDAFICWAVDPRCGAVIDTDKLVNIRFDVPREKWKRGGPGSSWRAQLAHFAKLRQYKFDIGIDLQGHSKTAICLRMAGAKKVRGVPATDPLSRLLIPSIRASGRVHQVERNIAVVKKATVIDGDTSPIMPSLAGVSRSVAQYIPEDRHLISISTGAGHPKKEYSREGWREVAGVLIEHGFHVVFLGGPEVEPPEVPGAVNLAGKLKLEETMAVVALSLAHLAADTGTGHIAAAYKVPVLSVFGHTDPLRFRPYTTRGTVLDAGPHMDQISPDEIVQAVMELIEVQNAAVPR